MQTIDKNSLVIVQRKAFEVAKGGERVGKAGELVVGKD